MERGRGQNFVKNCRHGVKKVSKTKKNYTTSKIADEPIIPHVHTFYCMEGIPIKMVRKSEPRRRDS